MTNKKTSFFVSLITTVLLLCFSASASAQRIQNSNYGTAGYIKSDGRIQDSSYRTIGYIKSDGRVQDSSYRTIGHIKSDGTVQDSNYRTIGYAKDVPVSGAALFFFFMK